MSRTEIHVRRKRKRFILRWFANTCSIYLTAGILGGMTIGGIVDAIIAALLLGGVNYFIRPFLMIVSLPFTILTLGVFTFVVNALMLGLTAWLMPGFAIAGFGAAFWGAVLISIFNLVITTIIEN